MVAASCYGEDHAMLLSVRESEAWEAQLKYRDWEYKVLQRRIQIKWNKINRTGAYTIHLVCIDHVCTQSDLFCLIFILYCNTLDCSLYFSWSIGCWLIPNDFPLHLWHYNKASCVWVRIKGRADTEGSLKALPQSAWNIKPGKMFTPNTTCSQENNAVASGVVLERPSQSQAP